MKMTMIIIFVLFQVTEHPWNETDGKTKVFREKPVPVSLRPPHIPHGLNPRSNLGLHGGRLATNHVSHGTA
jgi:hypothetical protein